MSKYQHMRCQIPDIIVEVPVPKEWGDHDEARKEPYQVLLMSLNEDREVAVFVDNKSVMQCTREDLVAFGRTLMETVQPKKKSPLAEALDKGGI